MAQGVNRPWGCVWMGARLFRTQAQTGAFELDRLAIIALGITAREQAVLGQLHGHR